MNTLLTDNLKKAKDCYNAQKCQAKQRGIKFMFSFTKWVKWWEDHLGSNWQSKRGRRSNQFCMARKGDCGPYVEWNVMCILSERNGRDRKTNGTSASGPKMISRAKLTEQQVCLIFRARRPSKELAAKYGVSLGAITAIKKRQTWRHITQDIRR